MILSKKYRRNRIVLDHPRVYLIKLNGFKLVNVLVYSFDIEVPSVEMIAYETINRVEIRGQAFHHEILKKCGSFSHQLSGAGIYGNPTLCKFVIQQG
jgi:hypothetical protein